MQGDVGIVLGRHLKLLFRCFFFVNGRKISRLHGLYFCYSKLMIFFIGSEIVLIIKKTIPKDLYMVPMQVLNVP